MATFITQPDERLDQLTYRHLGEVTSEILRQIVWDNPIAGERLLFDGSETIEYSGVVEFDYNDDASDFAAFRAANPRPTT